MTQGLTMFWQIYTSPKKNGHRAAISALLCFLAQARQTNTFRLDDVNLSLGRLGGGVKRTHPLSVFLEILAIEKNHIAIAIAKKLDLARSALSHDYVCLYAFSV